MQVEGQRGVIYLLSGSPLLVLILKANKKLVQHSSGGGRRWLESRSGQGTGLETSDKGQARYEPTAGWRGIKNSFSRDEGLGLCC